MGGTLINEENAGLTGRGLTTHGGFTYVGANRSGPPVYQNLWVINLLARTGYTLRVNDPSVSNGHMGNDDVCEFSPCET